MTPSVAAVETEAISKTTQSQEKADDTATKKPPERNTEVSSSSSSIKDALHTREQPGYSAKVNPTTILWRSTCMAGLLGLI